MTPTPREDTMTEQTEQEPIDPERVVAHFIEQQPRLQIADDGQTLDHDKAVAALAALLRERDEAILRYQTAELEQNAVIARLSAPWAELGKLLKTGGMDDPHFLLGAVQSEVEMNAALRAERDAAQQQIAKWKDRVEGLARFNPDWDRLEAAQDSLREHFATIKALQQQIATLTAYKAAFEELYATVQGECPSLLDPCRGGSDVLWNLCAAALQSTRPQEQP